MVGVFWYKCKYGGLAQSVERVVSNDEAPGSKPGFSTYTIATKKGLIVQW